jgi:hypothetical protein
MIVLTYDTSSEPSWLARHIMFHLDRRPNDGPAPRHYACPGCGEPQPGRDIGQPCGPCKMEADHLTA